MAAGCRFVGGYPITPSTEGGELYQQSFANGELNVWGRNKVAIDNIGWRLVHENETKYIGRKVADWEMALEPDSLVIIDDRQPGEPESIYFSNFHVIENRETLAAYTIRSPLDGVRVSPEKFVRQRYEQDAASDRIQQGNQHDLGPS